MDNLNGTLLICMTKDKGAQIFSFDPNSEWQLGRMCEKIRPTFHCLPGFHSHFVLRVRNVILCSKLPLFLVSQFRMTNSHFVPNLNVICSAVHFKDQKNHFWSLWLCRALDPLLNSLECMWEWQFMTFLEISNDWFHCRYKFFALNHYHEYN